MRRLLEFVSSCAFAALLAGCAADLRPANSLCAEPSASAGVSGIDNSQTVILRGNTPALARPEFDRGLLPSDTRFDRMVVLLLKSSAAQQRALDAWIAAQQDPHSPLYHRWLTPTEYRQRFSPGPAELTKVAAWLLLQGFSIDEISPGGRMIVFSGTARQVADAFHVEMHRYGVGGEEHIANAQDPQIPAALAGVIDGILSLHNFRRVSQIAAHLPLAARAEYSAGGTHYLFPADFATIYDLNPLHESGNNGAAASIAVIGRSNIRPDDVAQFRAAAALPVNHPSVLLAGADPGLVQGDQLEATLDVEWSGAVAPEAAVTLVAAPSSAVTDGVDLASAYAVDHGSAQILSVSYSTCEQRMGAAELAFYNALWEQAASEGISVFVASGDAGAAGCSAGPDSQGSQPAVNGLCSSPYATCVGGTEFNEGADATRYWKPANGSGYGSALGYIPEMVWNESALNGGAGLWASGGGVSTFYAPPAWQSEIEGAAVANGMRSVPDVALAAAGHDGSVMVENGLFTIVSGTSVAAPSFAGMMAMVVGAQGGEAQGSANPGLYALAAEMPNALHATLSGNNSVPGVEGFAARGETYNLATGLGSVDGAVLVDAWNSTAGESTSHADFSLSASPQSGTVAAGASQRFAVNVVGSGSAGNVIALSAFPPQGVAVSFSPARVLPGMSATATVTAEPGAQAGSQTITMVGSDPSGEQAADYILTVLAQPAVCASPLL